LRQKLNVKNGLLQAINTRFATFYFSEDQIILDVVPYGVKKYFAIPSNALMDMLQLMTLIG